jgi:Trypsin-like peptidase domain
MAAKVTWRHALNPLRAVIVSVASALMPSVLWAQDTSFLSGEALAATLRQNLVWLEADDIGEHGYGVVVGGNANTLWIVTARHVVAKSAMLGLTAPDQVSQQIRVRFCALPADEKKPDRAAASPVADWDSGGQDIALLAVARPRDHAVVARALAPQVVVGEPVWLLGSDDNCALVPAQGQVRASADASHNLRIDFPGNLVQGGSSGAPVLSGYGMLGLMKSVDSPTSTVHAMADLQRRVQAHPGARWELVDARNIPPGDPRAAQVDLAETLNDYLLAVRNVHMLFQQSQVPRPLIDTDVKRYNLALRRFMRVREAYDGSLNASWPPVVLPAWRGLREKLWAVHQNFWRIDPLMAGIYKSQKTSPAVKEQMAALEPELLQLEKDIAQFLRQLVKEN